MTRGDQNRVQSVNPSFWRFAFVLLIAISSFAQAQQAPKPITVGHVQITGVPDDWSHHHVVFSGVGTEQDAIQNGTYDKWRKIVNDPRYILQQLKRRLPAQGPAAEDVARIEEMARAREASGGEELAAGRVQEAIGTENEGKPARHQKSRIHRDWSMTLGSGSTVGGGMYPAKFSFSTTSASCANDFVVFSTSVAGDSSHPTITAFNNLYSGCGGTVPSILFEYNTSYATGGSTPDSGAIMVSPVLSLDGSQVAFVQSGAGNVASLVLLAWVAGGAGAFNESYNNVAPSGWSTCLANLQEYGAEWTGCITKLTFSGTPTPNDTLSSPFYDYGTDTLYVGDNSGNLHQFNPVFNATALTPPAEVLTSGGPWAPVSANVLTGPVHDSSSGNVFVGDIGGYLYRVSAAGTVTPSGRIAGGNDGIVDAPVLDSTPTSPLVYAFVGDDVSTPPGHSGVFQFATNFVGGTTGTEETLGTSGTAVYEWDGTFDNTHYTGVGTTGNLYVCGANETIPTLYQIAMNATFTGAVTPIGNLASNVGVCSPVTEIYNASTSTDWIFLSVTENGSETGCSGACIYNYDVSSTPAHATAGLAEAGGTSGIIIDNTVGSGTLRGASQVYFSSLSNETCAGNGTAGSGTGGCAVQASQSGLDVGNRFTLVTQTTPVVCDASSGSCVNPILLPSTGSGNLGVLTITSDSASAGQLTAVSAGGTWSFPATCNLAIGQGGITCGYTLSTTSGVTSMNLTFSAPATYYVTYWEYSVNPGPPSLDVCGTAAGSPSGGSLPGVGLTLTGVEDVILQWETATTASSISAPYGNFATITYNAFADGENLAVGTAPTWSYSSTSGTSPEGACAFK